MLIVSYTIVGYFVFIALLTSYAELKDRAEDRQIKRDSLEYKLNKMKEYR